jgi:virulence-associated protein VapD
MEELFKFVGVLLVGTAIGVCITANTKVDITPLKMVIKKTIEKAKNFDIVKTAKYDLESVSVDTIPKNLSTLKCDIVTPKKAVTTRKLSHSELLKKIRNEVGDDAVEYWMRIDYEIPGNYDYISDDVWDKNEKTHNIVMNNFKTYEQPYNKGFWEFRSFVGKKGYVNKDGYWFLKDEKSSSVEPALTTTQEIKQLPKKDFSQTQYSDRFVNRFRVHEAYIKNNADKVFDKKWNELLREMVNSLQQIVYGFDESESRKKMKRLRNEMTSYKPFLSTDYCRIYEVRDEQVKYALMEMLNAKRIW